MKTLVMLTVLAGSMFLGTGCATPAYSGAERWHNITRGWAYDWKQLQDDTDYVLLAEPPSHMTIWNVR